MYGPKSLLWIVWLGLVLVGIEVRHMHARVFDQSAAYIPILYCALVIVALPLCVWRVRPVGRTTLLVLFASGIVVGLIGLYFHTKFQITPFLQLFTLEKISGPQPLPPLALTGLATIGFLSTKLLKVEESALAGSAPSIVGERT